MSLDHGSHHTIFKVRRWDTDQATWVMRKLDLSDPIGQDFDNLGVAPYLETIHDGNLVTDAGWNLLMKNVAGTPGTLFSVTVGRIGVGNGVGTAAYTDTDLSAAAGSTNRQFKLISAAPTVGATHSAGLVFAATFSGAQANFFWNEFGVDQGTADGTTVTAVLLNHATGIAQGTKVSGQIWTAQCSISWS